MPTPTRSPLGVFVRSPFGARDAESTEIAKVLIAWADLETNDQIGFFETPNPFLDPGGPGIAEPVEPHGYYAGGELLLTPDEGHGPVGTRSFDATAGHYASAVGVAGGDTGVSVHNSVGAQVRLWTPSTFGQVTSGQGFCLLNEGDEVNPSLVITGVNVLNAGTAQEGIYIWQTTVTGGNERTPTLYLLRSDSPYPNSSVQPTAFCANFARNRILVLWTQSDFGGGGFRRHWRMDEVNPTSGTVTASWSLDWEDPDPLPWEPNVNGVNVSNEGNVYMPWTRNNGAEAKLVAFSSGLTETPSLDFDLYLGTYPPGGAGSTNDRWAVVNDLMYLSGGSMAMYDRGGEMRWIINPNDTGDNSQMDRIVWTVASVTGSLQGIVINLVMPDDMYSVTLAAQDYQRATNPAYPTYSGEINHQITTITTGPPGAFTSIEQPTFTEDHYVNVPWPGLTQGPAIDQRSDGNASAGVPYSVPVTCESNEHADWTWDVLIETVNGDDSDTWTTNLVTPTTWTLNSPPAGMTITPDANPELATIDWPSPVIGVYTIEVQCDTEIGPDIMQYQLTVT